MDEILEILSKHEKFPCKLSSKEGAKLRDKFKLDKDFLDGQEDKNDIERRYTYNYNSKKYILIEEFLFSENQVFLEVEKAIGINYYLNCVNP